MPALDLDTPLSKVVGAPTAKALAALDLDVVRDLLMHVPRRYAQRGELTDLASLVEGEHVTVLAEVVRARTHEGQRSARGGGRGGGGGRGRPSRTEVVVTDGTAELALVFFNMKWRTSALVPGVRGLFAGKVGSFRGQRQLTQPEMELLPDDTPGLRLGLTDEVETGLDVAAVEAFARALIPIYPASAKLPSWRIAKAVDVVLDTLPEVLPDPVPQAVLGRHGLPGRGEAFRWVHRPETKPQARRGRDRLAFDEAFVLQIELAKRRQAARALPARPRPGRDGGLLDAFDARLPFDLTKGQVAVSAEISADLQAPHPMYRLLQGEVGSGKTVVALRAMLSVIDSGGQAALLAPTEVLAQQHYRSLTTLLGPLAEHGLLGGSDIGTRVALLTGSMGATARKRALLDAVSGDAGIVVGTHALLEEHVQFADLGLVVIDEQHRFGVEQRAALTGRTSGLDGNTRAHVLVMTATPIPRTVAMTVFGDLDTSSLRELPAGRAEVLTHVVPTQRPRYLERTWERVVEEVALGRQVYIVCARIGDDSSDSGSNSAASSGARSVDEDSADFEGLDPAGSDGQGTDSEGSSPPRRSRAVLELAEQLGAGPLAQVRLAVLHGRLAADVKDDVMQRFHAGELDVVVATTVIEVGVDVPNASMMVVMDAERFGVSQLHQLRGRIGRGGLPGLCLLVTDADEDSASRVRLDKVAASRDGFELAVVDLEQRREGDVLGAAQSGRKSSLRLLRVLRDEDLIRRARDEAIPIVADDPELSSHPILAAELAQLLTEDTAEFLEKG